MGGLGALEAAVMDVLWAAAEPRTVRGVRQELAAADRPLAYTTVLTVLDNLHRKGWLVRQMAGRAWQYRPARSREAVSAELMRDALAAGGDIDATLVAFLEQLTPVEARQLADVLEQSSRVAGRRER